LTWVNPPAVFNFFPTPAKPAFAITAMAAYPPLVFTPYETIKIGEITSGFCSLACALTSLAELSIQAAPGMAFRRCW